MHRSSLRSETAAVAALALAFVAAAPLPAAAQQDDFHAHCRTLTKQIAHFEDVASMARQRNDDLWEASTEAHIARLEDRRERLCPEYRQRQLAIADAQFWSDMYQLMKIGAQGALRYLTFGAY